MINITLKIFVKSKHKKTPEIQEFFMDDNFINAYALPAAAIKFKAEPATNHSI